MSNRTPAGLALFAAYALLGCTLLPVSHGPAPDGYGDRRLPEAGDAFPNWPVPPGRAEELMLHREFERESARGAGAGTTGAKELTLRFPKDDVSFHVKWKEMDRGWKPFWGYLDGVNNSPRKEIAAWKIQELFLDPEDYVVPFTLAFCLPLEGYLDASATPTREDSKCVLGVFAMWLNDLTLPEPLFDEERFGRDYAYAYYFSNLNLFTYLVKHHDGREGNFLISKHAARPQIFSIDNGVSFGDSFNGLFYNWFVSNWNSLHVPALRKESIDRLRKLREGDVIKQLGVVAQLELNADGIFVNVPPGENLNPADGVRIEGNTIQLGLSEDELEDVWERIEDLIEDVDEGDISVF
jgi:hypothetical protein